MALMDAYVARYRGGFEEFGIGDDAVLLGNGFGGTLALAFALAQPRPAWASSCCATPPPAFPSSKGKQAFRRWPNA